MVTANQKPKTDTQKQKRKEHKQKKSTKSQRKKIERKKKQGKLQEQPETSNTNNEIELFSLKPLESYNF